MAKTKVPDEKQYHPDKIVLNKIQRKRLASLTGLDEKEFKDRNIADLSDILRWRIDPFILFFKKVCGRVVKKDPVTGVLYPVPFATVYVEDTDCNLLIYHPSGSPWSWHYPFFCHREILATTKTDACGYFCVWVPRFDIDWILHWRKKRVCFPILFKRPIYKDFYERQWPPVPNPPDPDPNPWDDVIKLDSAILDSIGGGEAENIKKEISLIHRSKSFGRLNHRAEEILNTRVFSNDVPAPLPEDFQKALSGQVISSKGASATDAIRAAVAEKVGVDVKTKTLDGFDPFHSIGPFYRCFDFYVRDWQIVLDVPDITFRVTQDTNGDGVEETIYSEGHFDVRWNSGAIPDVTLVASSIAKETHSCDNPEVPCANKPALKFAGCMPLDTAAGYFDGNSAGSGYALKPNQPRVGGTSTGSKNPPAQTPFCGRIIFSGCVDVENAKFYRVLQSVNGAAFSAITGAHWNNYLLGTGMAIPIVADVNGWYPVEPVNPSTLSHVSRTSLLYSSRILEWDSPGLPHKTLFKIELGNSSKAHIDFSPVVPVYADNTSPTIVTTRFSWKFESEGDGSLRSLFGSCPLIKRVRGGQPQNIELVFEANVSANHLRDCYLGNYGCGGGNDFTLVTTDPLNKGEHWHQTPMDNSVTLYQRYLLKAGDLPGCYSFTCDANSRSINPSCEDSRNINAGCDTSDWNCDPVFLNSHILKTVAVVDQEL